MKRMMLSAAVVTVSLLMGLVSLSHAYPKPNPYPVSWQFKFEHSMPRRIVLTPSGGKSAEAYWYVRYTVTNLSKDEQKFLPVFELMTCNGDMIRSDRDIADNVLAEIRIRERHRDLLSVNQIAGPIRVGVDQARDGVAIWKEPMVEMGRFRIFVGGLAGEIQILKDDNNNYVAKARKDTAAYANGELSDTINAPVSGVAGVVQALFDEMKVVIDENTYRKTLTGPETKDEAKVIVHKVDAQTAKAEYRIEVVTRPTADKTSNVSIRVDKSGDEKAGEALARFVLNQIRARIDPILLNKSFMMEYLQLGDDVRPGGDPMELVTEEWLMR